jgi:transcriptional regulator of arginine metabolism
VKNSRQTAILKIVSTRDIETQHDLIESLRAEGVDATQATISRDIKELNLIKELTARGTYRYTAGTTAQERDYSSRLRAIFRESVTSAAVARNIVVLHTLPGLADAACSAIDGMGIRNLVGSVAGDDTAFLAMTDEASAESLSAEIEQMI